MFDDDDSRPPLNRPAAHLLDELESLKGLLDDDGSESDALLDIPLLDDMVVHNLNNNNNLFNNTEPLKNSDLLNLNHDVNLLDISGIFDENLTAADFLTDDSITDDPTTENRIGKAAAPTVAPIEAAIQFPRFTLDVAISDDPEFAEVPPCSQPSVPPVSPPQQPRVRPDYSREVLIQELVDEFIPQIEAELHARLRQLDDDALRHLKDKK